MKLQRYKLNNMVLLVPNHKYSLKNIFSPQSSLEFIGFIFIAVITAQVANLFSIWNPFGLFGVLFIYLYWRILEIRRDRRIAQSLSYAIQPQAPEAAKGLILLLSLYSPRNLAKNQAFLESLIAKVVNTNSANLQLDDFKALDLFNSNLVPQIEAIKYHFEQGELRDVWFITSKSEGTTHGSEVSAVILEQYLRFEYGERIRIHSQNLCVKDSDYKGLSELAEDIFNKSGYTNEVMVADITGGTKMMSVALAIACVKPGLKMQYMDSNRDWEGNPLDAGMIKPIGIDVTSIVNFF